MAAYVQAHLAEKAMLQMATARIAAQQVRAPAATVRLLWETPMSSGRMLRKAPKAAESSKMHRMDGLTACCQGATASLRLVMGAPPPLGVAG
jgi:hypothetical protein